MDLRYSTAYGAGLSALLLAAVGLSCHGQFAATWAGPALAHKAALVKSLQLTDLCLFTEASYTRHLAMADLNTPFQDSPLSFEHFPTGSLVAPPSQLTVTTATRMTVRSHGQLP
jgi:hypothetical protein